MSSLWADDLDAHRKLVLGRLLDAYEELRAEHGPDGVTLAAVAARAGLARSAIYNYVANEHDLILTHTGRALSASYERLAAAVVRHEEQGLALAAYITETMRIHGEAPAAGDELMGMLSPDEQQELVPSCSRPGSAGGDHRPGRRRRHLHRPTQPGSRVF